MAISVVIPTKNRLPALQATVDALTGQDLESHRAEIIVVDNGSTDDTVQWLAEAGGRSPMEIKIVEEPSPGVSAARNAGVRHAQFDLILFLNNDTTPADSRLLARHIATHARTAGKEVAALGRITYPPEDMADPFMRWLNDGAQFDYAHLDNGESPRAPHFFTAHISFPRAAYLRAGGMDERLRFGFEDAALGHRMQLQGVPIHYHPELVVYHHHQIDVPEWRRRVESDGRAGWDVNRLYPIDPPLAQPATSLYWRTLATVERVLGPLPTNWSRVPSPVREWVYSIVHFGCYARGYLKARREGST
jgi:GT2 family glycosyltransferase